MPPGSNHPAVVPRVVAHYARCAELLDAGFGGSPIVLADFPRGFHAPPRFRVTQIPLSAPRIGWLVQREYAVEFHTWAPLISEPERLRFARILLNPPRGERDFARVKETAMLVREQLLAIGYDAIALVDGLGGIALWLPFDDAPLSTKVRARFQRMCARTAGDVRPDASTNVPGRFSAMPYSLRGTPALPVCSPVTWEELDKLVVGTVCTAETWPQWFEEHGDLFATLTAQLRDQQFRRGRLARPSKQAGTASAMEG